jgi:hypothetical protein
MSPVILVGYLVWVGKLFAAGRSGVSVTAQGPLSARFSEHNFGTRQDEAADRLLRALPGVPRLGLRLTTGPVLLAYRYRVRAAGFPIPLRGRGASSVRGVGAHLVFRRSGRPISTRRRAVCHPRCGFRHPRLPAADPSSSVTSAPAAARIGACCPPPPARHKTGSPESEGNHSRGTVRCSLRWMAQDPARASATC